MKNGTRFNSNRLVLVNNNGFPFAGQESMDDTAVDYRHNSETEMTDSDHLNTTLVVLASVSLACAAAAIATGSYALWLSRQQTTQKVLTDVNEILKSCQSRMQQLESDVQHRPGREA